MRRRNWRVAGRLQRARNQLDHCAAIAIDERSLQSHRTAIETGNQFRRAMFAWRDQQIIGGRRQTVGHAWTSNYKTRIRVLAQGAFEIAIPLKFENAGGKSGLPEYQNDGDNG